MADSKVSPALALAAMVAWASGAYENDEQVGEAVGMDARQISDLRQSDNPSPWQPFRNMTMVRMRRYAIRDAVAIGLTAGVRDKAKKEDRAA